MFTNEQKRLLFVSCNTWSTLGKTRSLFSLDLPFWKALSPVCCYRNSDSRAIFVLIFFSRLEDCFFYRGQGERRKYFPDRSGFTERPVQAPSNCFLIQCWDVIRELADTVAWNSFWLPSLNLILLLKTLLLQQRPCWAVLGCLYTGGVCVHIAPLVYQKDIWHCDYPSGFGYTGICVDLPVCVSVPAHC